MLALGLPGGASARLPARPARHPGRLDRLAGQALPLGEQAEHEVQAGHLRLAALAGGVLRLEDDHLGPVGEPVQRRLAGDEALLHRLLGDPHALPDRGPGGTGAAGLVDEVPDQVVGQLVDVAADPGRLGELVEGRSLRVPGPDLGDELVQRHASTLS